jgi:hypothetical protein
LFRPGVDKSFFHLFDYCQNLEVARPWTSAACCAPAHSKPRAPRSLTSLSLCNDPDTALSFFALRLLKRLQDMATVGAMDFDEYTRVVWLRSLDG